jgi:hypothetical protein
LPPIEIGGKILRAVRPAGPCGMTYAARGLCLHRLSP